MCGANLLYKIALTRTLRNLNGEKVRERRKEGGKEQIPKIFHSFWAHKDTFVCVNTMVVKQKIDKSWKLMNTIVQTV